MTRSRNIDAYAQLAIAVLSDSDAKELAKALLIDLEWSVPRQIGIEATYIEAQNAARERREARRLIEAAADKTDSDARRRAIGEKWAKLQE